MIIGTGIDIVELQRIRKLIETHGHRFLQRIYSPAELAYAGKHHDAVPSLAARFAAKEAFIKAVGHLLPQQPSWTQISVISGNNRPPEFLLDEKIRQHLPPLRLWLTLSHEKHWAIAEVIAESCE